MKSNFYEISRIDESTMLILSTSFHSPLEQLDNITKELVRKKFKGKIIFDMLLSNGSIKERFFESSFHNSVLEKDLLKQSNNLTDDVLTASKKFYSKNIDLIENSMLLSNAMKFVIKKGKI